MDDSEHVCPLCCEELDLSDQQFYPCKCGYQVCMWCWHRIRESESGLCPACRTPYGDDPHEFSAVDVEEVLKANREKEAAAKRARQMQQDGGGLPAGISSTDSDHAGEQLTGIMEVPKDRTQLANMRVIRRNLVYAVGLPPSISNEDTLRKPEYFGQYGKINKIVLNRNQASGGDPRRTSTSAYVTFFHKEDTLACILAVDGFYLEGRNIRASYGTSKYCSAFIKNVRCNNPECTYLHEMGAIEDTFTKQEIQAGYVTSGRDVLARQQQIVQQALSESQGASGTAPRRKIGGGGPSGTGRASANPVFPVPEFDEPSKPAPVPVPVGMSRAASTGTGFPTVAAAAQSMATSKLARAASTGASAKPIPVSASQAAAILPIPGNKKGLVPGTASNPTLPPPQAATAASVVAGVHSFGQAAEAPAPHTTLTPLTPLKRASKPSSTKSLPAGEPKMPTLNMKKTPKKINGGVAGSIVPAPISPIPTASPGAPGSARVLNELGDERPASLSSLGGEVIGAPPRAAPVSSVGAIGGTFGGGGAIGGGMPTPIGSGGLRDLNGGNDMLGGQPLRLGSLGGEVFTGPLKGSGPQSAIGSGNDKWLGGGQFNNGGGIGPGPSRGFNNNPNGSVGPGSGALWNNGANPHGQGSNVIGGSVIGPQGSGSGNLMDGNPFGGMQGSRNSGSSALASLLGIHLPNSSHLNAPGPSDMFSRAPNSPAPIGPGSNRGGIGGLPIGGNPIGRPGGIGGDVIGGNPIGGAPIGGEPIGGANKKNDIALLQSLLPEVHITSGNVGTPGFPAQQPHHQWGSSGAAAPVGAVGRNNIQQQAQRQGSGGNIW